MCLLVSILWLFSWLRLRFSLSRHMAMRAALPGWRLGTERIGTADERPPDVFFMPTDCLLPAGRCLWGHGSECETCVMDELPSFKSRIAGLTSPAVCSICRRPLRAY